MIAYHWTNLKNLKGILESWFLPRKSSWAISNWTYGHWEGKDYLVYFSTAYAAYYAAQSSNLTKNPPVIIKVDIPDSVQLYPDEEFIQHILREDWIRVQFMEEIDNNDFIHLAREWIDYLWTFAVEQLDRQHILWIYVPTNFRDYLELIQSCDPSISNLNYLICGPMYKQYLEKLQFEDLDYFLDGVWILDDYLNMLNKSRRDWEIRNKKN